MNYNEIWRHQSDPKRFEEKPAYLYSLHKNKLECFEGLINICHGPTSAFSFTTKTNNKRDRHRYTVSTEEGVVSNLLIWFFDKNDEEAKRLFIENENQEIEELSRKIEKHKENIAMLEKE